LNLRIEFFAQLNAPIDTPAVLMVEVATSHQAPYSDLRLSPYVEAQPFLDMFGNPCRKLILPAGETQVAYSATVAVRNEPASPTPDTDTDPMALAADILQYTLPSRYCQSDRFEATARDLFGSSRPGLARIQDICSWINRHIEYQYGTTNSSTSAADTLLERRGVCRDFAHLAITFCRALYIPARYVSGYCLGLETPDLHAYFEAFLGGRWRAFDATSPEPRQALVRIGTGLDAAMCAWLTAYGMASTTQMTVAVTEDSEGSLAA